MAPLPSALTPGARLVLLVALFYAGWAKFALPPLELYLADYTQRLLLVALAFPVLRQALTRPLALGRPRHWLLAGLGATAIILIDLQTQALPWRGTFDNLLFQGADFPSPPTPWWNTLDLTFGLALVAVSEELVFRAAWAEAWHTRGPLGLYLGSTLAFACLHLPQGLADTAIAALWGLLLMLLYRRSASLPLVIGVHYLADVWYFA